MALIQQLAKHTAVYGISSIATRVLSFIFLTPFLTYNFDTYAMGIQSELYSWAAFLMIPFTYRLETAFFRYGADKKNLWLSYRTASLTIVFNTLLLVFLFFILKKPLSIFLEYQDNSYFLVLLVFIVATDALMSIPFACLRLEGKALSFALLKMSNMLLYLGLIWFFVSSDFLEKHSLLEVFGVSKTGGIGKVFIANLLANLFTLLCLSSYFIHIFNRRQDKYIFSWPLWTKMFQFSAPLLIVGIAAVANEVLDRTMLKYLLEGDLNQRLSSVGIYGACYKIAIFMNLWTQAYNFAAEPFFFKYKSKTEDRTFYASSTYFFTLVSTFIFLLILFNLHLFQYFVAEPYRQGLQIVPLLLLSNLFLGLYYQVAVWYKLADKTNWGALISLLGVACTISFNLILIPRIGYIGAAWATVFCYGIMLLSAFILGQYFFPMPYNYSKMAIIFTVGILLTLFYYQTKPFFSSNISQTLWSQILLFIYVFIFWYKDKNYIKQILKQ